MLFSVFQPTCRDSNLCREAVLRVCEKKKNMELVIAHSRNFENCIQSSIYF
jgi:hypothetical protein